MPVCFGQCIWLAVVVNFPIQAGFPFLLVQFPTDRFKQSICSFQGWNSVKGVNYPC